MHDWRNFNNVEFESIMVILYDKQHDYSHTPRNLVTASLCFRDLFFFDALYISDRPT